MNKGVLYGIGIGPGDPELITIKAINALKCADIIYVPKSKEQQSTALAITKEYISSAARVEQLEFPMSKDIEIRKGARKQNALTIENQLDSGLNVAFLTLGDPMLYSTYSYILEYLGDNYHVNTIPGIYSFSAISNTLNNPLCKGDESLAVICALGEQEKALLKTANTIVCMKLSAYCNDLYHFLNTNENCDFSMITDAGKETEKVYATIEILKEKVPYFSTAIIKRNR